MTAAYPIGLTPCNLFTTQVVVATYACLLRAPFQLPDPCERNRQWRPACKGHHFQPCTPTCEYSCTKNRACLSLSLLGYEGILAARLEHHVRAAPWLIVYQPPFVALADMVLGEKDITRVHHECLAVRRSEF